MALKEMPIPAAGDAKRVRRAPEDNWPGVYPESITTVGGLTEYILLMARIMIALSTRMVGGLSTTGFRAMQQTIGCWISMT